MRISDWSSDVCSSDLFFIGQRPFLVKPREPAAELFRRVAFRHKVVLTAELPGAMQFGLFEDALAVGVVDDAQVAFVGRHDGEARSEEHTSELQSLMRRSYAVFCLTKQTELAPSKTNIDQQHYKYTHRPAH